MNTMTLIQVKTRVICLGILFLLSQIFTDSLRNQKSSKESIFELSD
jgi:hypothetical protein